MAVSDDPGAAPALHVDEASGRATITLRRPRHHNRLHREDLLALQDHCATLAATAGLRVLVLAAEGEGSFCAGYHLGELAQGDGAAADDPRLFVRSVDALAALALPSVARLHGGVFGGAVDLALACDFRVGVQGMQLRMPAVRLGLHYDGSGLRRFVAKLGLAGAKRVLLRAETLDAVALQAIGFLDDCVPPEALDAAVERIAAELAAAAPLALQGMKASLDEIALGQADDVRMSERQARCAASADLREGLAAWAHRRPPRFGGR